MSGKGDADLLRVLQNELQYLEQGGYRKPSQNPWKANSIFLDSPTCINRAEARRTRSCSECPLIHFVPSEGRDSLFPCHHIPLTEAGDTVNSVERWGDQEELEEIVGIWLRMRIRDLELRRIESSRRQERGASSNRH